MDTVTPPPGATDAFLTPYHVDRAEIYIRERYSSDEWLDVDTIITNIGRTRFPVPSDDDHKSSTDFPGLVRAADLIGQLADPQYFRKIASLYAEFQETGQAAKMGYTTAANLCAGYPKFFWEAVNPYISEGLCYLRHTWEGRTWVANRNATLLLQSMKPLLTARSAVPPVIAESRPNPWSRPRNWQKITNAVTDAVLQNSLRKPTATESRLTSRCARSQSFNRAQKDH